MAGRDLHYAVCVKPPDDASGAVKVFGPIARKDQAEEWASWLNRECQQQLDMGEPAGRAYVLRLRAKRWKEAKAWALHGKSL